MSKPHQGPMFAQLNALRGHVKTTRRDSIKDPSPSPMLWKADGEDHINIGEKVATDLGQVLTHNSKVAFDHSVFGRFSNMEAFWHYIQSEERDDRIRTMSGQILKAFARKLTQTRVTNFRAIIMDSNYQRIKQYEPIVNEMKASTLPFDCYYVDEATKLRIRPSFFKWMVMGFEEIRRALKEDREPNFNFLLDRQNTTIYQFAVPQVRSENEPTKNNGKKQGHHPNKGEKKEGGQRPPKSSLLTRATEAVTASAAPVPAEAAPAETAVAEVQPQAQVEVVAGSVAEQVVDSARSIEAAQQS